VLFAILCAVVTMPAVGVVAVIVIGIAWLIDTLWRSSRRARIEVRDRLLTVRSPAGSWECPLDTVVGFSVEPDWQRATQSLLARQGGGHSRTVLVSHDADQLNWIARRLNEAVAAQRIGDSTSASEL
jgi:hypothetical protein